MTPPGRNQAGCARFSRKTAGRAKWRAERSTLKMIYGAPARDCNMRFSKISFQKNFPPEVIMVSSHSVPANPAILRWAREDAGLSLEEAARKARINALAPRGGKDGVSPAERLRSIESGESPLTISLLQALAKAYQRPEVTFFLPCPPRKEKLLADFRTVDSRQPTVDSPEFAALKRHIIALHKGLKDIAEAEEDPPLAFVGSIRPHSPVDEVVPAIKAVLGQDPRDMSRLRDENDFFHALREQAQQAGIYVILLGDLGSHHTAIPLEVFRGLSISDPRVPLIVINPNDTLKARVFSLLHEICHIFIGATGYCSGRGETDTHHDRAQETFCNAVAAEYLVPEDKLRGETIYTPLIQCFDVIAKKFKVSSIVIARRAKDLNKISQQDYDAAVRFYIERARSTRNRTTGGPDANKVLKSRLGKKLISKVVDAAYNGHINFNEASSLLGISVSRLDKVAR